MEARVARESMGLSQKEASALLRMQGMGNLRLNEKIIADSRKILSQGSDHEKFIMTPIEDTGTVGQMFDFQNNKIYAYCSFDTVRNIYREIIAENQYQLIEATVGQRKIGESLKDRFNILR